jgi:hypothetical protein
LKSISVEIEMNRFKTKRSLLSATAHPFIIQTTNKKSTDDKDSNEQAEDSNEWFGVGCVQKFFWCVLLIGNRRVAGLRFTKNKRLCKCKDTTMML